MVDYKDNDMMHPENMGQRGLDYWVPRLFESLEGHISKRRKDQTEAFVGYMDRALERARELELDHLLKEFEPKYRTRRERALELIKSEGNGRSER